MPPGRVVKQRRVEWGRMAALRPTTRFSYGVQCAGSTTSGSGSDENEDLFLSKPCSRFNPVAGFHLTSPKTLDVPLTLSLVLVAMVS